MTSNSRLNFSIPNEFGMILCKYHIICPINGFFYNLKENRLWKQTFLHSPSCGAELCCSIRLLILCVLKVIACTPTFGSRGHTSVEFSGNRLMHSFHRIVPISNLNQSKVLTCKYQYERLFAT